MTVKSGYQKGGILANITNFKYNSQVSIKKKLSEKKKVWVNTMSHKNSFNEKR